MVHCTVESAYARAEFFPTTELLQIEGAATGLVDAHRAKCFYIEEKMTLLKILRLHNASITDDEHDERIKQFLDKGAAQAGKRGRGTLGKMYRLPCVGNGFWMVRSEHRGRDTVARDDFVHDSPGFRVCDPDRLEKTFEREEVSCMLVFVTHAMCLSKHQFGAMFKSGPGAHDNHKSTRWVLYSSAVASLSWQECQEDPWAMGPFEALTQTR